MNTVGTRKGPNFDRRVHSGGNSKGPLFLCLKPALPTPLPSKMSSFRCPFAPLVGNKPIGIKGLSDKIAKPHILIRPKKGPKIRSFCPENPLFTQL
jgi:hypothetical protein